MNVVESGAFQVMGFACLKLLEALEHVDIGQDGTLDNITRESLEVKEANGIYAGLYYRPLYIYSISFFHFSIGKSRAATSQTHHLGFPLNMNPPKC